MLWGYELIGKESTVKMIQEESDTNGRPTIRSFLPAATSRVITYSELRHTVTNRVNTLHHIPKKDFMSY